MKSSIKYEIVLSTLTTIVTSLALAAVIKAGYIFVEFGSANIPNQESVGFIVNVEARGRITPTYDIYLLHGTDTLAEGESDKFSIDPNNTIKLINEARKYQESGLRIKLIYDTLSFSQCYKELWSKVNDCDIVTKIERLK
jgi:hypothetical protein